MIILSRRRLAEYGAEQLLGGQPPRKIAKELAAVLIETKKTKDTELLVQDIAWELEDRGKLAGASITSASDLSENLRRELTRFIKQKAKVEHVSLQEHIDRSVIGGIRIETAKHAWDKTVAKQLTEIKEMF